MEDKKRFNAKELFEDSRDLSDLLNERVGYEACWEWPLKNGSGAMHMITFRPGFMMGVGNFQVMDKFTIQFENMHVPLLRFNFGISGRMDTDVDLEDGRKILCTNKPSHGILTYLPRLHGLHRFSAGGTGALQWIVIYLDPNLLGAVAEIGPDRMPNDLCKIVAGENKKQFYRISPTDHSIATALYQIVNCPYQGFLKRFYLESKGLELIAHTLAQLIPPETHRKKPFSLRPQDIERVQYAKELTLRDLQNPPKLIDLAKTVGLTHPKLNYGFREIYGTTFFNYLRQTRLKKAKSLLAEGRMNVTEAAYAVGYSSLSSFSKSFTDYHGIAPGTYLRKVLRNA
ncbi:helix-turn-helix domain-containing protein [Desulfobacter curvatus]|uniref:helix-turn-helix domain-containing protein n=1 Tax=Desulfobacter curvatus TaxID=2290 RepID=UPI00036730F9|nr:AraC family transcriptional regulator [Desulfobacter curvatus]